MNTMIDPTYPPASRYREDKLWHPLKHTHRWLDFALGAAFFLAIAALTALAVLAWSVETGGRP